MRRTLLTATALVVVMTAGAVAVASGHRGSDQFDDVPRGHWADEEIGWAVVQDITKGVSRYRFDPDGTVSRAQIVTFLYRLDRLWEEGQPRDLTDVYEEMDDLQDDVKDLTGDLTSLQKRLAQLEGSDGRGDVSPVTTTTSAGGPIRDITCSRSGTIVAMGWDLHAGDTSIPVKHRASRGSVRNADGDVLWSPIKLNNTIINPSGSVEIEADIMGVTGQTYSRCEVRILASSSRATADNRRITWDETKCTLNEFTHVVTFAWTLGGGSQQLDKHTVAFQASLRQGNQTLYSEIVLNEMDIDPSDEPSYDVTIAGVEGDRFGSCTIRALR